MRSGRVKEGAWAGPVRPKPSWWTTRVVVVASLVGACGDTEEDGEEWKASGFCVVQLRRLAVSNREASDHGRIAHPF